MKQIAATAVEKLDRQRVKLDEIMDEARKLGDEKRFAARLDRWQNETVKMIGIYVNPDESRDFDEQWPITSSEESPLETLNIIAESYYQALDALIGSVMESPELYFDDTEATSVEAVQGMQREGVFIAHGHDETNALRLQKYLKEKRGLNAWFLSERVSKSRTIIEKFEQEAGGAEYAFVLLTPDDIVRKHEEEYSQPRPNPIFELGWLYRHLGRSCVCILFKEGTKPPTDLLGINYVPFKDEVTEAAVLIDRELDSFEISRTQPKEETSETETRLIQFIKPLKRFLYLWEHEYGKDDSALIKPRKKEFETSLKEVREMIVSLLASENIDSPMEDRIAGIAKDITSLAYWEFFLDGGVSVSRFDDFGDELAERIKTLISEIE